MRISKIRRKNSFKKGKITVLPPTLNTTLKMSSSLELARQWHSSPFFMQSLSISKELQWRKQRLCCVPSLAFLLPTNWGFQLVGPMSLHPENMVHSYQREQLHFERFKIVTETHSHGDSQHKDEASNIKVLWELRSSDGSTQLSLQHCKTTLFHKTSSFPHLICALHKGRVQP